MEEKTYPIYKFTANWDQEDYKNNGNSTYIMYKENPTDIQLNNDIQSWKLAIEKHQIEKGKPITQWLTLEYQFIENETWCLQWFYHMTYNQFENDHEAFCSFENFVSRKERLNEMNGHYNNECCNDDYSTYYCLMGAEDRWRWEVCHCDGCEKNGWTTIKH